MRKKGKKCYFFGTFCLRVKWMPSNTSIKFSYARVKSMCDKKNHLRKVKKKLELTVGKRITNESVITTIAITISY